MDLTGSLKTIFQEMEEFLTTKAVVGEPIEVGTITLIPVINVTFGMGTGGGSEESAKDSKPQKGGAGAGLGAKISPTAVIVIKEGDISVIPLNGNTGLERLIDMVPDIVKKIKKRAEKGQKKETVKVR
ncbi:MAG: sporulation protein [Clostridiales bacterium]|jgi:uncharacterized spore protein YtfJ|nr:sporulation protein [Clostridiales bacterium]HOC09053.1 spore germination protein GerW family protein [Bacillota bacterium]